MITLRIPTKDPYAYLEVQFEGTAEEAVAEYHRITGLVNGGAGVEDREFNGILDNYLWGTGTMTADEYGSLNEEQQKIIQTIKRSRNRLKNK